MALIVPVRGFTPEIHESCFVAENATIVGDVKMGEDCSVWFQAIVRGDVNSIRLGNKVNVQDGAIIHCTYEKAPTNIGNSVSIGHAAIVHGCTIHNDVLIGMRAVVMDHAILEPNTLIAAGAVVLENTVVEEGWLYAGVPAKKIKRLDSSLTKGQIERIANNYVMYSSWYK